MTHQETAILALSVLTPQQRETLLLTARGWSREQCAAEQGVSVQAIALRRCRVLKKLQLNTMNQACYMLGLAEQPARR